MRRWELNAIAAAIALSYSVTSLAAEEATAEAEAKQDDTEVITVTGVQYSDHQARLMEREKDQFSTAVSTDDMGNMVDQNVAESLRRLPGVSLQRSEGEGKFVNVRGLGPQFVSVNMNGSEMAGAGEDRKVGLDGIAGDSLGAIEVFKTLTPDMNLNSIGGAVNVKSISAFDRRGDSLKIKVQESYSDLREEYSPKFTLDGTQMFADETIGVGFVVSSEDRASMVNEQKHHTTNPYRTLQAYQPDFDDLSWDPETTDYDEVPLVAAGDPILAPYQVETRQEQADRERDTIGLNVEWRPSDEHKFYVKGNYVRFTDEDVALREYYRFDKATTDEEILYVNSDTKEFILNDAELQHQYFVQESEQIVKTFSLGGEHLLGDSWKLNYDYSSSRAREDSVDDRRVQFREQNVLLYGQATKDEVFYHTLTVDELAEQYPEVSLAGANPGAYDGDGSNPDNWEFDNMFLEDSIRTDEINTFKTDLTYEADSDWLHYVKFGVAMSERVNELDKNRWSFVPTSQGCKETYAADSAELAACYNALKISQAEVAESVDQGGLGYGIGMPLNGEFQYPFVDKNTLEYLTQIVGPTKYAVTGYNEGDDVLSFESSANDYTLEEKVNEAYVMGKIELMEDVTLITGVRYVQTEFTSTGTFALSNDEFAVGEGDGSELDIFVPLAEQSIKYSEFFPSAHLRWEYSDEILIRASIWTSYTRPTFKQNRAYAQFKNDVELCAPTGPDEEKDCQTDNDSWGASALELQDYTLSENNTLVVGNPNIIPMTSVNYDFSLSWYESEDLFVEWSLFYKDIQNFIVDYAPQPYRLDELPFTLPVSQVSEFIIPDDIELTSVQLTDNGDDAYVFGMELSYNQFFDWGGFVQSNVTLQTSEGKLDPAFREGTIQLPDQSDVMANLTVGWENDTVSARLIGNYRSEILEEVGYCPDKADSSCRIWSDKYMDDITTLDFKAKWKITGDLSVYFDAINLTENVDLRYYQGNDMSGGNVLAHSEFYGKTYQLGVNYKFY